MVILSTTLVISAAAVAGGILNDNIYNGIEQANNFAQLAKCCCNLLLFCKEFNCKELERYIKIAEILDDILKSLPEETWDRNPKLLNDLCDFYNRFTEKIRKINKSKRRKIKLVWKDNEMKEFEDEFNGITRNLHYYTYKTVEEIYNKEPANKNANLLIKKIIEGNNIDAINLINLVESKINLEYIMDEKEMTPLHYACIYNNIKIVEKLVSKGVNINAETSIGKTPLYIAIEKGYDDIIEFLIDHGVSIESENKDGCTLLQRASQNGDINVVKYLINNGANIESKDKNGFNSLCKAIQKGNLKIVEYLFKNGAKIDNEVLKYLFIKDSKIESRNKIVVTLLHSAFKNGQINILKYLVENGADINKKDENGSTLLHIASKNRKIDIVKYLIEKWSLC